MKVLIVGCGLSGAVLAERLASEGHDITIIDKRNHIGGNCYDYIDENGILMNKYGAHLFHTNNDRVIEYVKRFADWRVWEHKVVGRIDEKYFPIPVNIDTVNTILDLDLRNEEDMSKWLEENQTKYENPRNGKEAAMNRVGEYLYNLIFHTYTKKQWDKYPEELDPSVLQRIPVRNNRDSRYFSDKFQALPSHGYTKMFENMLNNKNIKIKLQYDYFANQQGPDYDKIIYTGPIDQYFANKGLPKLEYRSINFVKETHDVELFQENSVINYPGPEVDFTRIVEYKHLLNQKSEPPCKTTIVKEYSIADGEPYYPVPNDKNKALYEKYKKYAEKEKDVLFVGRLASYKYYNMDEAIFNALQIYDQIKDKMA